MSVRQELNRVAERWSRAARGSMVGGTRPGERLAGWANRHASEAFFGCDGPSEAAIFSALVELQRMQDTEESGGDDAGMDP